MTSIISKLNKRSIQEYIRLKLRQQYIKRTSEENGKLINNDDFTIISNNCWGGFVYQSYGISYKSPTIGMYIMPDDYINFLRDLKYYISLDLNFIKPNESKYYNELSHQSNFGTHPIGRLGDIELMLLHYHSTEEAYEKWNKRRSRINWDKLIVKFNDQNNCKYEHIKMFDQLDYKYKIFFSANMHPNIKSEIYIDKAKGQKFIPASLEPIVNSKYIDINQLVNSLYD